MIQTLICTCAPCGVRENDTSVRAYLSRERLDTVAQTQALNALYEQMWPYYDLFPWTARVAASDAPG